jgi:pimeloyl-ACP methyl ester carboxylesterase
VLILLHGLGSDLEVWRAQLERLRTRWRVVAYDQRGHGGSERARDGVYTIEALAEDLEAVRRSLGLREVVLAGHSLSGEVLTTYAGAHPERVLGLFYLDAVGDFHAFPRAEVEAVVTRETAPTFGAAERRAVFAEMLEEARPETRERVLASLDRIDPPAFGLLRKALLELVDAGARYAPYRGPAVALEAGDQAWPGAASAVLGIRRVAIHGVSHWMQLDDPERVTGELEAFLGTLPGGR